LFYCCLVYVCELPLHFIAKVKVIKVKKEVCRKSFHNYYFVVVTAANVILLFKKQGLCGNFLLFFFLGFLGLEDFCIFIREAEIEDGGAA